MRRDFYRFFVVLQLFFTSPQAQNQNYVTVNCSQGIVRGQNIDLGNDATQLYNGQASAFTGIPYCQPPIGDRRLQSPEAITKFNSSIHDATYFRPKCPQLNSASPTDEDCLYLNIYTPQPGNRSAQLGVLVLIDGSNGFSNGGRDENEVKGIVTNLVQRKIVVVTLQYRIGALGFFTTYTNVIQSNLGMLDQVEAMRWIKSEIVNFGGNPNQITVAGQDDGACAVSAHCLSPMSQNLFNQAIIQSGSIYSCYNPTPAVPTNPTIKTTTPRPSDFYGNAGFQNASSSSSYNSANALYDDPNQQFASTLCNISADQWNDGQTDSLRNCLKNYTVDFFVNQSPGGGQTSTWMIVRDNTFLPDSIDALTQKRPNIPIIIGTVQDEDADYAFKLINTGKGDDPNNLNNWIFDFARKNKLNQSEINKVQNIIDQNYGINNIGQMPSQNPPQNLGVYQNPAQNQGMYQNPGVYQNPPQNQGVYQNPPQNQGIYQNPAQNQGVYQNPAQNQGVYQNPAQNQGVYQNLPQNPPQNQGIYQNQYPSQDQLRNQQLQYQYFGGQVVSQTMNQNQNQYPYQNQNANQYLYQNQNPNQYPSQNQNPYPSDAQNQNPYTYQNQNPNQYPSQNQNPNQYLYQNQNPNQYPYQNQNPYPSDVQNQNPYTYQNQNPNQYPSQNQNPYPSDVQNQNPYPSDVQNQNPYPYQNQNPNNYQGGYSNNPLSPSNFQRDQGSSGVTDYSQLKKITQIASDQSISLTTTQIQSFTQNGDRHVRVYQFTHVSDVGRNDQPNTGADWKPVFKGQDMYFITMSETIWTSANYTAQDRHVANEMGQRWSDFVKTGQVENWAPTDAQNYNYCNLNTQPTQQSQYGQQARHVFQDQINPIVQEAQNNFAQQNNLTLPYPNLVQPMQPSQGSMTPSTANAQYSTDPNRGQNFHITFQVNNVPSFNG